MPTIQNTQQTDRQILISFIIPVYNVPATMLNECLKSIIALSLRPYEREIIVVDDGSTKPAINGIDDFIDDIIYIRQKNGGLGSARNRGLQNASGRYIQFVDGDDALSKTMYEHCLDIARFQEPDIITFEFSRKKTEQMTYNDQPAISGKELMRHHNIKASACCYLFKSSILGKLRFTPCTYHEDEEFTPLLLLRAETVVQTDATAYFYREREYSITTGKDVRSTIRRLTDFKAIIVRLYDLSDKIPGDERIALKRRIHQLTMDYICKVIVQTRNRHYLDRQLGILRKKGLFPLPDRDYTKKYKWFRRLTNSNIGLSVLMRFLPLMKRER